MSTSQAKQQQIAIEMARERGRRAVDLAKAHGIDELKAMFRQIQLPATDALTLTEPRAFQVASGALQVIDPRELLGEEDGGTLERVKPGRWLAHVAHQVDDSDLDRSLHWYRIETEALGERAQSYLLDEFPGDDEVSKAKRAQALASLLFSEISDLLKSREQIENLEPRIHYLHIHHEDHPITGMVGFERADMQISVDSGMAGFFDQEWFASKQPAAAFLRKKDDPNWSAFYDDACDVTREHINFGVLAAESGSDLGLGVVSASGWGDGGYSCYFIRDLEGEVIAARIIFIGKPCAED